MIPINHILFLDIETVPQYKTYAELPDQWKPLWDRKAITIIKDRITDTAESVYGAAGIYAEFGKIICISCGVISNINGERRLAIKSFYGDDEQKLLGEFCEMVTKWDPAGTRYLCAHNGKEFDFPYLSRRLLIQNMCIPPTLDIAGKKRWEIQHLDTMDMWKFGDYKSYTSLNLLSVTLGIPTPKDDIDGSKVGETYWVQNDLQKIVTYCQKDVVAVAQVYLRLTSQPLIADGHVDLK